jgi:hypothetical protein
MKIQQLQLQLSPREEHAGFMVDRTYCGKIWFQNFDFPVNYRWTKYILFLISNSVLTKWVCLWPVYRGFQSHTKTGVKMRVLHYVRSHREVTKRVEGIVSATKSATFRRRSSWYHRLELLTRSCRLICALLCSQLQSAEMHMERHARIPQECYENKESPGSWNVFTFLSLCSTN